MSLRVYVIFHHDYRVVGLPCEGTTMLLQTLSNYNEQMLHCSFMKEISLNDLLHSMDHMLVS